MSRKKLCVPAIWDKEYFDGIVKLNNDYKDTEQIFEVYGALPSDVIGSIRPAWAIQELDLEKLEKYIDILHRSGIRFDYVINSTISPIPQNQNITSIIDFIGILVEIGIDSLTISNPFLCLLIKRHYPNVYINASVCNEIQSIHQIREFDSLGIDCLVLDRDVNRDFEFLRRAKKITKSNIKLLCNSVCLFQCINVQYHANYSSFLSNRILIDIFRDNKKQMIPFCSLYCKERRIKNPIEHIKIRWIRPEDLILYDEIGIDYYKIDGRDKNSEYMLKVIESYLRRKYNGNFLHLLNRRYIESWDENDPVNVSYVGEDDCENAWKIWIDNRELDGFIEGFVRGLYCCTGDCSVCNVCNRYTEKIRIDKNWQKSMCERINIEKNGFLNI